MVVSRKTCAKFSAEIGLGHFLFLGKGVHTYGVIPSNMLADVFESLVAGIFIDGGWDVAKAFVLRFIRPEIECVARDAISSNAKSQLQTVTQREYLHAAALAALTETPRGTSCSTSRGRTTTSASRWPRRWATSGSRPRGATPRRTPS